MEGESRLLDLCLILTDPTTHEPIVWAGGVWDRVTQSYRDDLDPVAPCIIEVEPSQVAFFRWFAVWLQGFREGRHSDISLVLSHGGRRGGKTFANVLAVVATLLDVPSKRGQRCIGWIVSNTYKKKLEIEEQLHAFLPKSFYTERKAPEYSFTFANGTLLRNLSADDPEDLRQGRADVALYNEAQLTAPVAIQNGLFGVSDREGLTLLAANPPSRAVGEWLVDLKEAHEAGDLPEVKCFAFDPKLNRKIEQDARRRAGRIGAIINPSKIAQDDEGEWSRTTERAYPRWKKQYLQPLPDEGDITSRILQKKEWRQYTALLGCDFQGYPANVAVVWRLYPAADGKWIYHAADEFWVDGPEQYLINEMREAEYNPGEVLVIGDASGQWQDGKHDFGKGGNSFKEFQRAGYTIKPPREKKSDGATYSSNPPVENRLRLVARIMDEGRILVDPDRCPMLAAAFKECPLKRVGTRVFKHTHFAHLTDAADYPVYYLEPRIERPKSITPQTMWSLQNFERAQPSFF